MNTTPTVHHEDPTPSASISSFIADSCAAVLGTTTNLMDSIKLPMLPMSLSTGYNHSGPGFGASAPKETSAQTRARLNSPDYEYDPTVHADEMTPFSPGFISAIVDADYYSEEEFKNASQDTIDLRDVMAEDDVPEMPGADLTVEAREYIPEEVPQEPGTLAFEGLTPEGVQIVSVEPVETTPELEALFDTEGVTIKHDASKRTIPEWGSRIYVDKPEPVEEPEQTQEEEFIELVGGWCDKGMFPKTLSDENMEEINRLVPSILSEPVYEKVFADMNQFINQYPQLENLKAVIEKNAKTQPQRVDTTDRRTMLEMAKDGSAPVNAAFANAYIAAMENKDKQHQPTKEK